VKPIIETADTDYAADILSENFIITLKNYYLPTKMSDDRFVIDCANDFYIPFLAFCAQKYLCPKK